MNSSVVPAFYEYERGKALLNGIKSVHDFYHKTGAVKKGLMIVGAPGKGKTHLADYYASLYPPQKIDDQYTRPIFYFPFKGPKKNADELLRLLIPALGAGAPKRTVTSSELEAQFIHLLKEKRVELIFFDEIQSLATKCDGIEFQRIIKFFCWLLDSPDIRCSFVMLGVEASERFLNFGSQRVKIVESNHLERRMRRPMHILDFHPKRKDWLDCVNWFMREINYPALNPSDDQQKFFLCRLYLAYRYENSMSTLRDLLLQENCQRAVNLSELQNAVKHNFHIECKSAVNLFDEDEISNATVMKNIEAICRQVAGNKPNSQLEAPVKHVTQH